MPVFGSVTARTFTSTRGYAYVKVSEGCSNHCNYCLIPTLRGELTSKPDAVIIEECEKLIKKGDKGACSDRAGPGPATAKIKGSKTPCPVWLKK